LALKNKNITFLIYRLTILVVHLRFNKIELGYNDLINCKYTWIDAINESKLKYPKPKELQNV